MGNCLDRSTTSGNHPGGITKRYEDLTQRYLSRFHYETQITNVAATRPMTRRSSATQAPEPQGMLRVQLLFSQQASADQARAGRAQSTAPRR